MDRSIVDSSAAIHVPWPVPAESIIASKLARRRRACVSGLCTVVLVIGMSSIAKGENAESASAAVVRAALPRTGSTESGVLSKSTPTKSYQFEGTGLSFEAPASFVHDPKSDLILDDGTLLLRKHPYTHSGRLFLPTLANYRFPDDDDVDRMYHDHLVNAVEIAINSLNSPLDDDFVRTLTPGTSQHGASYRYRLNEGRCLGSLYIDVTPTADNQKSVAITMCVRTSANSGPADIQAGRALFDQIRSSLRQR